MTAANLLPSSSAKRYGAVPVKIARRPHAAGRDDRPRQRPRRRRHLADERLRGASRRRARAGHRRAHPAPEHPRRGHGRRGDRRRRRRRDRRPARVGLRRAGHQARALAHRPGRRAGRLRHPLRARRGRPRACATASTACSARPRAMPRRLVAGVISRIKIMADLDIAERRVPQDGRVSLEHRRPRGRRPRGHAAARGRRVGRPARARQGRRRSSTSTSSGWSTPSASASSRPSRARTARSSSPGPTGSGKTTTLYAALQMLHTPEKNIITIEDPVEYELSGIKQMQINPKAGLTLRHAACAR